ncbi:MAG: F0F1 ATP synthase subunit delta [Gammaproteobacteria bacterium]|nr:F0F1 ATP synthase subunit delta [Gammaproteobacteria bacterium]
MDSLKTLARPYAKAAFEYACEQKKLKEWSESLALLASVAENAEVKSLYDDPSINSEQLSNLFAGFIKKNENLKNFILLLSEYDRLSLLPEIAELFEEEKAEYEKVLTVQVTSAFPMDESTAKKLKASLTARLKREVNLEFEIDKGLVGGAVIRAGDWVVDGSVRAKLEKLKQAVIM